MSTKNMVTGAAQGMLPALLIRAASIYRSPLQALLEYFQNGLDEPSTRRMWALIDKNHNQITIGDDGTGMGGAMSKTDAELVDLYYKIIAEGESPGCDLRDLITDSSTHTLEWFVRNIANSIKSNQQLETSGKPDPRLKKFLKASGTTLRQRRATMGKFGIGAWAFLSLANKMTIMSKPNPELARSLGITHDNPFVIFPPSREDLNKFQLGFEIRELANPLRDLEDNELPHGTIIRIEGITEEAWDHISVDLMVAYLRDAFGTRIESTGIEITVADTNGRVEVVPPQVIRGRVLIDEDFNSIDGTPCRIMIYYDQKARNLVPKITKLGVTICLLDEIKIRDQSPFAPFWLSGRVGGRIAFEHLTRGDDDLFDTSKHGIVDSNPRRFWINKIKELEKRLAEMIKAIEAEAANERLNLSQQIINKTLRQALESQGIFFPGIERREEAKGEPKERQARKPLEHIIIHVVDRNGHGVPGVNVNLRLPPYLDANRVTGVSGMTQFGNTKAGEYRVRIDTEHPVIGDKNTLRFTLDPNAGIKGKRVRFVLDIGEPQGKITTPTVAFNVWDDPGEPWRQSVKSFGIIEVNIGAETILRQLLDREHFAEADGLMAEYTTAAIMEALGETGDHASRVRQSALFAEIATQLQISRSEGTRATRRKTKASQ